MRSCSIEVGQAIVIVPSVRQIEGYGITALRAGIKRVQIEGAPLDGTNHRFFSYFDTFVNGAHLHALFLREPYGIATGPQAHIVTSHHVGQVEKAINHMNDSLESRGLGKEEDWTLPCTSTDLGNAQWLHWWMVWALKQSDGIPAIRCTLFETDDSG